MDAAIVVAQGEPAREVVRDARGVIVGVIGRFDRNGTRTAEGRLVSRSNVLSALLLRR